MLRDQFNHKFFQFIGDTQKIAYELTNEFQPEGITQLEYTLLEHLYYFKSQHLDKICRELLIPISTGRRYMSRLVAAGYVDAVKDDADGRRKIYAITREGKLKLDACFFQIIKGVQDRFDDLDDETISNVTECITYITKVLYKQP